MIYTMFEESQLGTSPRSVHGDRMPGHSEANAAAPRDPIEDVRERLLDLLDRLDSLGQSLAGAYLAMSIDSLDRPASVEIAPISRFPQRPSAARAAAPAAGDGHRNSSR